MALEKGWKQPFSAVVLGDMEGLLEQIPDTWIRLNCPFLWLCKDNQTEPGWQDPCADLDEGRAWRWGKLLVSNHRCRTCHWSSLGSQLWLSQVGFCWLHFCQQHFQVKNFYSLFEGRAGPSYPQTWVQVAAQAGFYWNFWI